MVGFFPFLALVMALVMVGFSPFLALVMVMIFSPKKRHVVAKAVVVWMVKVFWRPWLAPGGRIVPFKLTSASLREVHISFISRKKTIEFFWMFGSGALYFRVGVKWDIHLLGFPPPGIELGTLASFWVFPTISGGVHGLNALVNSAAATAVIGRLFSAAVGGVLEVVGVEHDRLVHVVDHVAPVRKQALRALAASHAVRLRPVVVVRAQAAFRHVGVRGRALIGPAGDFVVLFSLDNIDQLKVFILRWVYTEPPRIERRRPAGNSRAFRVVKRAVHFFCKIYVSIKENNSFIRMEFPRSDFHKVPPFVGLTNQVSCFWILGIARSDRLRSWQSPYR
mmetsp:Transcript_35876/g.73112  ORF Transcript_35876/g.73112 Transcript_35876/m.73112 type:complete len:336 (+) Transcript_35876:300-1307(+)